MRRGRCGGAWQSDNYRVSGIQVPVNTRALTVVIHVGNESSATNDMSISIIMLSGIEKREHIP